MNKTTKAKYDMAEKMLKVNISLDEVALMTELPMETLRSRKRYRKTVSSQDRM